MVIHPNPIIMPNMVLSSGWVDSIETGPGRKVRKDDVEQNI
jgi:hypothetical protein